jgi:hypothetical protein
MAVAKIDRKAQRLIGRIDSLTARVFGEMTLVQWMAGLSITLNGAVLIRLFSGRPI